jgi:hypothetical protein
MSKIGKKHIILREHNLVFNKTYYSPYSQREGEIFQKLEITGPLGTQSIVLPDIFDISITSYDPFPVGNLQRDPSSPCPSKDQFKLILSPITNPKGPFQEDLPAQAPLRPKGATRALRGRHNAWIIWGTLWTKINQMLIGVTTGFKSYIKLTGIGYKANLINDNKTIAFYIGFGHPVNYDIPSNIVIQPQFINNTSQGSLILVTSNSLPQLNNFIYHILKLRPASKSFKGTGISILKI